MVRASCGILLPCIDQAPSGMTDHRKRRTGAIPSFGSSDQPEQQSRKRCSESSRGNPDNTGSETLRRLLRLPVVSMEESSQNLSAIAIAPL